MTERGAALATNAQKLFLKELGATAIPDGLTTPEASSWIDEIRAYARASERGLIPQGARADIYQNPPGWKKDAEPARQEPPLPGFATADKLQGQPAQGPVSAQSIAYEPDEERGALTPLTVIPTAERKKMGVEENGTVVLRGTKWNIIPELGMPAKFVFARINKRTGDVRLFPAIEGLVFRANAYNRGIKKYTFEFIEQKDIPGLAPFIEETKDPELVCRVHVTLGDGTEVTEHGTVRLSEITLYKSQRTGKMVARSPVARTNPTELAVKRALARALRWGTGFGGTALDELPVPESEEAREQAGLKGGQAALPPAE
jgi:hypothetical protein